jgi:uncharacterized protein (DUF1501 family)
MSHLNIISRRSFLDRGFKVGLGVALSTLVDIPFVMKRALAEGAMGLNGKKLLFVFLRGANDALNSVIPIQDPAYFNMGTDAVPQLTRPIIGIPRDPAADYAALGTCFDPTLMRDIAGTPRVSGDPTYSFDRAIPIGNGFAALHPALKFLAPVYNAGDVALVHRVGYPDQSRSHFDSQDYWETGAPGDSLVRDGIFYRAILESGLANRNALTGISIQSSLPLLLRGAQAAMTNLSDPTRYSLLGLPHPAGRPKTAGFVDIAGGFAAPDKLNRELLRLQYQNMTDTMTIFEQLDFSEDGNVFRDDLATDGDNEWYQGNGQQGYYLFPTTSAKNGGFNRPDGSTRPDKYAVATNAHNYFRNLKAAAILLNNTDAIIAGTEFGGFDTHSNQGGVTGQHADLQKRIAWSIYALKKYFTLYGRGGSKALPGARVAWEDVVVVTLSEFGRTTVQNSDDGTDHAEAGLMFVAGGQIQGAGRGRESGVIACGPGDAIPWVPGPPDQGGNVDGTMFGVSGRYLRRCVDYRSVLGELIRDHLGATPEQLARIVPGYADPAEALIEGGTSLRDETPIVGEVGLV